VDEPNSNLDSEADEALTARCVAPRERGAVVIVVAHRPSASRRRSAAGAEGWRMQDLRAKEPCSRSVAARRAVLSPPIQIVADAGAAKS